jgi:hypothetical protein
MLEPSNKEDIHSLWMGPYHIWGFVVFHIDMKNLDKTSIPVRVSMFILM